jgi:hypothetical protein
MPAMDPPTKKTKSSNISLLLYFLISVGVALQIGGANWDIVWHGSKDVESFLTPPHSVIYTGVALSIGSIIYRSIFFSTISIKETDRRKSIFNILKIKSILP